MALRLIEVYLPQESAAAVEESLDQEQVVAVWQETYDEGQIRVRILLPLNRTQATLDALEERFSHLEGFRLMLLSVEATLPRPDEASQENAEALSSAEEEQEKARTSERISRQELYTNVDAATRITWTYLALVILSSIVAAVGLLRDQVAVVIGAMVIAPLLGPNTALALATTLGDFGLSRRAIKVLGAGVATALALSALIGIAFSTSPLSPALLARTETSLGDVALALAAGGAGTLAYTMGLSAAVIGVMVAVALLPPLVSVGILLGGGHWQLASGAALLVATNLICINLAGVVTFLLRGMRPLSWWDADRAKRATRNAIVLWTLLLAALMALVLLQARIAV